MSAITIVGSGMYVPGDPVPNVALSRVMDTNSEWIIKRTGIHQRHFAPEGVGASDLGVVAARRALENAQLQPEDVDYIMFATMTPDQVFPGPGALCGAKLGIPGVPALDIRQQCAAVPFALQVAQGLVQSRAADTILFIAAETHAGFMPWKDWDVVYGAERPVAPEDYARATRHRGVAVVFGDGAGAFVLRRSEVQGRGYLGGRLVSDGRDADFLIMESGGFRRRPAGLGTPEPEDYVPRMRGPELFKRAVKELPRLVQAVCDDQNVALDQVDWVVAHQANERINESVRQTLQVPAAKMPSNIAKYGNTSGATIPILIDELRRDGRIAPGDLVLMLALGAGLHLGACLLRM